MQVCKLTKNRLDHRRFPVILQKQSKQPPKRKYINMTFIYFTSFSPLLFPPFLVVTVPGNVRITELSIFSSLVIYSSPSTYTNIDMLVPATLFKKVQKRCFSVNFGNIFKNTFFANYPEPLRWLLM